MAVLGWLLLVGVTFLLVLAGVLLLVWAMYRQRRGRCPICDEVAVMGPSATSGMYRCHNCTHVVLDENVELVDQWELR